MHELTRNKIHSKITRKTFTNEGTVCQNPIGWLRVPLKPCIIHSEEQKQCNWVKTRQLTQTQDQLQLHSDSADFDWWEFSVTIQQDPTLRFDWLASPQSSITSEQPSRLQYLSTEAAAGATNRMTARQIQNHSFSTRCSSTTPTHSVALWAYTYTLVAISPTCKLESF